MKFRYHSFFLLAIMLKAIGYSENDEGHGVHGVPAHQESSGNETHLIIEAVR